MSPVPCSRGRAFPTTRWWWSSTAPVASTTPISRIRSGCSASRATQVRAGGFGAGLEAAFADPTVRWAYLCEDDVGLFSLPAPRLASVLERIDTLEANGRDTDRPVGAVVAYGRRFVGRGSHTVNV